MDRWLRMALLLVTFSEGLIAQWASLAFRGEGMSVVAWVAVLAVLAAVNILAFPAARARLRARGVSRFMSRGWLLFSVAALLAGTLLAAAFALSSVLLAVGYSAGILGVENARLLLVAVGGTALAFGFGSIAWGASIGQRRVVVEPVDLPMADLPPGLGDLRMAHITDLHIGPLLGVERLRDFVERVNHLEPDLIFITGDLFDFDPAFIESGCRELGRLSARHGVFAVLGNHDVYTGADAVAAGLARFTGIRLLRDEWSRVEVGDFFLCIVGVEDSGQGWTERESENPALERLAREIPDAHPCLLLCHRPSYFRQAARLGFPFVLAGHTHGGQIALPLSPHQNPSRIIAHWTRGLFELDGSVMYVNRGLGVAGLPVRLNCAREIAILRLVDDTRLDRRFPDLGSRSTRALL